MAQRPVCILICALGGEGGGVLSEWLMAVARAGGFAAQATSVPGVAQRTGATSYYLELLALPRAQLQGRRPVFGLNPVPGQLDALVSSELLETVRQVGAGMTRADRTHIITAGDRTLTTVERMAPGDGRVDSALLVDLARTHSRSCQVLDMQALARQSGTVVSAVMLGAIAASGLLPMPRILYEQVLAASGTSAAASLRGFAAAWDAVATGGGSAGAAGSGAARAVGDKKMASGASTAAPAKRPRTLATDEFPAAARDLIGLGLERVLDHQGVAYAELYLQRLRAVHAAERSGAGAGSGEGATVREVARWLALWMAYDDIVRVADLKSRLARMDRVAREVRRGPGDLLRVHDYFKPGAAEFAGLLPPRLAAAMLRWDARRVAAGREPFALPLKLASHSLHGALMLRILANLRWLRPHGSRHLEEQAGIEQWLGVVCRAATAHPRLGLELARCGRLVKGYGETQVRGKATLRHVLEHLAEAPMLQDDDARAEAIAQARQAAMSDASGKALDQALVRHQAPPRPLAEQPIRWLRRPAADPARVS